MMKKEKKKRRSTKVGGAEKKGVEGRVGASSGTARLLGASRCERLINERRARWAAKRCGIRGHIAAGGPPLTGRRRRPARHDLRSLAGLSSGGEGCCGRVGLGEGGVRWWWGGGRWESGGGGEGKKWRWVYNCADINR